MEIVYAEGYATSVLRPLKWSVEYIVLLLPALLLSCHFITYRPSNIHRKGQINRLEVHWKLAIAFIPWLFQAWEIESVISIFPQSRQPVNILYSVTYERKGLTSFLQRPNFTLFPRPYFTIHALKSVHATWKVFGESVDNFLTSSCMYASVYVYTHIFLHICTIEEDECFIQYR